MSKSCYFETLSESIVALHANIIDAGAEIAPDWSCNIYDKGHVAYGTTHTFDWPIVSLKGKPTRKYFHASIYRMDSGRYEVTSYIL